MSIKDGEIVEVYRTAFDYCATESTETKRFWLHGVVGFIVAVLSILAAIAAQVAWFRMIWKKTNQKAIYLSIISFLDMVYAVEAIAHYSAPYLRVQPSSETDTYYYRRIGLGRIKLMLEVVDRFIITLYILILGAMLDEKETLKKKSGNCCSCLPKSVRKFCTKHGSKRRTGFVLAIFSIASFVSHAPLLAAWRTIKRYDVCFGEVTIIALSRTKYGRSASFYWIYNRVYVSVGAYTIPLLPIISKVIINIKDRGKDPNDKSSNNSSDKGSSSKRKNRVKDSELISSNTSDKKENNDSKRSREVIPIWMETVIAASYIPVAIYSLLERLQESGVAIGLPTPGITYIIHLLLSLGRIALYFKLNVFTKSFVGKVEDLQTVTSSVVHRKENLLTFSDYTKTPKASKHSDQAMGGRKEADEIFISRAVTPAVSPAQTNST